MLLLCESEKIGVIPWSPLTAPIIGATRMSHLEDAVAALSLRLTPEEISYMEELYVPYPILGHQ